MKNSKRSSIDKMSSRRKPRKNLNFDKRDCSLSENISRLIYELNKKENMVKKKSRKKFKK